MSVEQSATEQRPSWRRRLWALAIASVGAAAASAISFAMTVYEAAHPKPVPVAAVGQPIDTGRWIVTFREARTGIVPPTGVRPYAPKPLVMVEFDIDNRSATSSNGFARLFTPEPAVPGLKPPTFYLARDKAVAGSVQPGLPERMIASWEWPAGVPVPQQLRLQVGGQTHKRRDNLYAAPGWFDGAPAATVTLAVSPPSESQPDKRP